MQEPDMVVTHAGAHASALDTGCRIIVNDTSVSMPNVTIETSTAEPTTTPQPQAAVDDLQTPAASAPLRASGGTPQCSMSAALDRDLHGSAIATPTEDLVAQLHATLAESRDAFQVQETPTSADPTPAGDGAEVQMDGACDASGSGTADEESVPLSADSLPLAMAPSGSVDLPDVPDEVMASVPCSAQTDEEPLPLLSPVQTQVTAPASTSAAAAVEDVDLELEGESGEVTGGDENSGASPAAGGAIPRTSNFQVPTATGADEDERGVGSPTGQEAADDSKDAGEPELAVVTGEHATMDLAMEGSDAVIEHDEDTCTRMDSPVPAVTAATGTCVAAGVPSDGVDVPPGDEGDTVEYLQIRSRNAMSPADISILCSPLRESTCASLMPCTTWLCLMLSPDWCLGECQCCDECPCFVCRCA